MQRFLPRLAAALLAGWLLPLGQPATAQIAYENFAPNAESVRVDGAWKRYQTHVLKLGAQSYAVLFRPGFVDNATALRAIAPLCTAHGLQAVVNGAIAPVDLVLENGVDSLHQGVRVTCAKAK